MTFLPSHRQLLTAALLASALFATSCQSAPTAAPENAGATEAVIATSTEAHSTAPEPSATETQSTAKTETSAASAINAAANPTSPEPQPSTTLLSAEGLPQTGILRGTITGDIQCYLEIETEQGQLEQIGASFNLCIDQPLNQRVQLTYEQATLNDCESIEYCGKTREAMQVSEIEFVETGAISNHKLTRYENKNWTITVGNQDSWTGVNNTGNLSYFGCDAEDNCLSLPGGGTMSCRDGLCGSSWRSGDFTYSLLTPISGEGEQPGDRSTRLVVREGETVIVDEQLQLIQG